MWTTPYAFVRASRVFLAASGAYMLTGSDEYAVVSVGLSEISSAIEASVLWQHIVAFLVASDI